MPKPTQKSLSASSSSNISKQKRKEKTQTKDTAKSGRHQPKQVSSSRTKCQICGEMVGVKRINHLYEHITKNTGKFRFSCEICGYETNNKKQIDGHGQKEHNDIDCSYDRKDDMTGELNRASMASFNCSYAWKNKIGKKQKNAAPKSDVSPSTKRVTRSAQRQNEALATRTDSSNGNEDLIYLNDEHDGAINQNVLRETHHRSNNAAADEVLTIVKIEVGRATAPQVFLSDKQGNWLPATYAFQNGNQLMNNIECEAPTDENMIDFHERNEQMTPHSVPDSGYQSEGNGQEGEQMYQVSTENRTEMVDAAQAPDSVNEVHQLPERKMNIEEGQNDSKSDEVFFREHMLQKSWRTGELISHVELVATRLGITEEKIGAMKHALHENFIDGRNLFQKDEQLKNFFADCCISYGVRLTFLEVLGKMKCDQVKEEPDVEVKVF